MGQRTSTTSGGGSGGFTLVELLVVLAIVATLLSIAAPRYFDSLERAKEASLRTDLRLIREAIDKYRADTGQYPQSLQALEAARYIRQVPVDPVTDSDQTWQVIVSQDPAVPGVVDVRSGAAGVGRDGTEYGKW